MGFGIDLFGVKVTSAQSLRKESLMRTIAIANQKGGCGKTTTAINLSSCLVLKGKRVLLVDFDPQAHATMGLAIDYDPEKTIYHVMAPEQRERMGLEDITVPVKERFDIAPSDIKLSATEQELAGIEGRENILMRAIGALEQPYDFVIIDCPPSIGHLCFNALRASSEVIIPIDMSLFSLRGITKLTDIMVLLEDSWDHKIVARALITMFDVRTRYSRHVMEKVREKFQAKAFGTVVRYNIRLRETVDHGLPVSDYDKHAIGQKDYENLAEEVISSTAEAMAQDANTSTHDILQKTEDYLDSIEEISIPKEQSPESDEGFPYPAQSTYSAMIDEIASNTNGPSSEQEEPFDDY
jgi:chromosome partitioning protein